MKALSATYQKIWEQKKWLTEWVKSLVKQCDASFGAGRSTVEYIFDCRVIIAKHLEHQRSIYHNFIDFKKAFDIVCHDSLRKVLIGGTIYGGFTKITQAL